MLRTARCDDVEPMQRCDLDGVLPDTGWKYVSASALRTQPTPILTYRFRPKLRWLCLILNLDQCPSCPLRKGPTGKSMMPEGLLLLVGVRCCGVL